MTNVDVLEKLQGRCNAATYKKLEKLLKALEENAGKDDFWNVVRSLTKNVHSDKSIHEWQIIAESVYGIMLEENREEYVK